MACRWVPESRRHLHQSRGGSRHASRSTHYTHHSLRNDAGERDRFSPRVSTGGKATAVTTAGLQPVPSEAAAGRFANRDREGQCGNHSIFAATLAEWLSLPINSGTAMRQVQLLGKLEQFDKNLSVNKNQACTFCHMPYTGFRGSISSVNATTVAYPGLGALPVRQTEAPGLHVCTILSCT